MISSNKALRASGVLNRSTSSIEPELGSGCASGGSSEPELGSGCASGCSPEPELGSGCASGSSPETELGSDCASGCSPKPELGSAFFDLATASRLASFTVSGLPHLL